MPEEGIATAGVQRQYAHTAGRTENAHVADCLAQVAAGKISDGELAFYGAMPPGQLVKVAGSQWRIEDGFAGGRELAGLDECQVRL